jgi:hypothetical protein
MKRAFHPLTLMALSSAVAMFLAASCATSEVSKSERWSTYPGCNAAQCKSWYEECSAECINDQSASVTECENKCRGRIPACEEACAG